MPPLAGGILGDETRGGRPPSSVLIAAASAKVRLALELRGTLDCRCEHESQILSSPGSWGGPVGWRIVRRCRWWM